MIEQVLKSVQEKQSFLIGLVHLSKTDGVVTESEKQYFLHAAFGLGLEESATGVISEAWESEDMPELKFDSDVAKLFFIREGIQLCYVDNKYHELERDFLRKCAVRMGIDLAAVVTLENWVEEGLAWKSRGDRLIGLEG